MKAMVVKQFVKTLENLHASEAQQPTPTASHPIQVRITHAALTHVDLLYAQGLHQNNRRHAKPPFILGTEFAGIVTHSPSTSRFPPGTRVFGAGMGAFAESICVDEASVRSVPDAWTNAEACAVGVSGAVSWASLVPVGGIKEGQTVLVLGAAGGLGVVAVQIAKAYGAKVIAVVGSRDKADLVKSLGADEAVDYGKVGWEDRVKELTPTGEGVDLVYDAVGAVQSSLKCLKYGGRVVIVGFAGRGGSMEGVKMNRILLKAATVVGYRFGEHGRRAPNEIEEIWDNFMKLVDGGKVKPVVYKEHYQGFESIPRALRDLEARKTWGRAVVTILDGTQAVETARL